MKVKFIKSAFGHCDMTIGKIYEVRDAKYWQPGRMVDVYDDVGELNALFPSEYEVIES